MKWALRGHMIIVLLGFCIEQVASQILDDKVASYMSSKDPIAQYDLFSDIMFGNSEYSLEQLKSEADLNFKKSKQLSDLRYKSMAYSFLGDGFYLSGQRDSALHYYLLQATCLQSSAKTKSAYTLVASGLGNAANTSSTLGKRAQSISLAKQALPYAMKIGDPRGEADLYYVLANGYNSMLQSDSALHYFNKCYDINLASGDIRSMTSNRLFIGGIYATQGKYDLSLESYKKAIVDLHDTSAYHSDRSKVYCDMAIAFQNLNQIDSALHYIQRAKGQAEQVKSTNYQRRIDLIYIDIMVKDGQLDGAQVLLDELNDRVTSQENLTVLLGVKSTCINLQLKKADYKNAERCLQEALEIVESSGIKNQGLKLYPQAIAVYENLGNLKKALYYSKLNAEAVRDFNNDEVEKAVLENNFKYETEHLNRANEMSKLENELLSTQLEKRKITTVVLSSLLIFSGVLFYLVRKHFKDKERLAEQVKSAVIAKKEKQYLEKEMEALRAQMNPHFLFNSLNSINHYILNEEPRAASGYLTKFSQLMRSILSNSKKRYVSLEEELKAIRLYAEMENVRFDNRFEYIERINLDVDLSDIYVPPLIIQPFIENAIKHAFTGLNKEGAIILEIDRKDDQLFIDITDNGIGRKEALKKRSTKEKLKKSYGLDITRDRLELISKLYGFDSSMQVEDLFDAQGASLGTKIRVHIPVLTEDKISKDD